MLGKTVKAMLVSAFGLATLQAGDGARAGDLAHLEPIGFSENGSIFAYQESGIQDGSGFPYANIFLLDLAKDRFIEPSPVRVLLKDEMMSVADAMSEARGEAASLFAQHMPEPRAGQAVVENLATDLSTNDKTVRFVPRAVIPPVDEPVELRLSTFPLSGPELCDAFSDIRGFRLVKIALKDGETTTILHEDTGIPTSRNCPLDYAIRQVRIYPKPSGGYSGVAIIAVQSVGFEGPDTRHIAVPVPVK